MADRRVTSTSKADDGTITALCNTGEWWSPRSAFDAINDIESKMHSYYVDQAGYRTDVHIVDGVDGKYLRTTADETDKNNLANLPDC